MTGLRYVPHVAVASVGYVFFGFAAVPVELMTRFDFGVAEFGALTSASLLAFVVAQWFASRLSERYTATRVLLWGTVLHAVLAVALDFAGSYDTLLAGRFAWGLTGGFIIAIAATHVARFDHGGRAIRHQGILGAMITVGGALGFVLTPIFVERTTIIGLHGTGALIALPAIAVLFVNRHETVTEPDRSPKTKTSMRTVTHPVVVGAAVAYVAALASYITLSTFITSFFDDLGVVGPLNVVVLLTATAGRITGTESAMRLSIRNRPLIAGTVTLGAVGFGALAFELPEYLLLVLPVLVMFVVSLPFGAIYQVAADATSREGTALATVIAAGNLGALALPALTGFIRESTGTYRGGFIALAAINAVAAGVVLALISTGGNPT